MSFISRYFNGLLLFTFALLAVFIIRISPAWPSYDTYYHLAIGRQVWQEKAIPNHDEFVYSAANTRFISTEWFSGLIFYGFYNLLEDNSFLVLRLVAGLSTLLFLYLTLKTVSASKEWILASLIAAGYVIAFRLNSRPEMFSFVLLSAVNLLCFSYYFKRRLNDCQTRLRPRPLPSGPGFD